MRANVITQKWRKGEEMKLKYKILRNSKFGKGEEGEAEEKKTKTKPTRLRKYRVLEECGFLVVNCRKNYFFKKEKVTDKLSQRLCGD